MTTKGISEQYVDAQWSVVLTNSKQGMTYGSLKPQYIIWLGPFRQRTLRNDPWRRFFQNSIMSFYYYLIRYWQSTSHPMDQELIMRYGWNKPRHHHGALSIRCQGQNWWYLMTGRLIICHRVLYMNHCHLLQHQFHLHNREMGGYSSALTLRYTE